MAVQLRAVQVYLPVLQGHRGPRRGGDLPVQVHIYTINFVFQMLFSLLLFLWTSHGECAKSLLLLLKLLFLS